MRGDPDRALLTLLAGLVLVLTACGGGEAEPAATTSLPDPAATATSATSAPEATTMTAAEACGHDVDPALVAYGYNEVMGADGAVKAPQGRPLQEGDTLVRTAAQVTGPNAAAYARVAAFMMPIRDALMCDLDSTSREEWEALTRVLTLNGIKTTQDLSGTPPERVYSTDGIFEHLQEGADLHPMMKYLEEAELELKCLAFVDFDFTNPEGDDHCEIHGLDEGSGLVLP